MHILDELRARGLVETVSDEPGLTRLLNGGAVPFYCGYDPTAKSLQIGNLCAILTMRRLQLAGHKPVAIVGGATGMIGDPSGKNAERNLLDADTIVQNVAAQRKQLEKLLDFSSTANAATILNNHDWIGAFSLIDFLRDVGKRFRLSEMLAKESVKRRLESPEGISFTEFTYQILQSYDFLHLYRNHGVRLQIGGGDQWGNIAAGIDLIRKEVGGEAYGLVIPIVTDAQGKKFGKSEGGTLYLDPTITSPYQMYQYLYNTDDAHAIPYLKIFTFLTLDEIENLALETQEHPERRAAQKTLAGEVVKLVHGSEGVQAAEQATRILFGEKIEHLSDSDLATIFADVPSVTIPKDALAGGIAATELLAKTPLYKSKGEARRAIEQKGVYLNNTPLDAVDRVVTLNDLATPTALVLRKGKKSYCLVRVGEE